LAGRRLLLQLIVLATLLPTSGATCSRFRRADDALAPAAFLTPPTLDEIIYAVNANSGRVRALQTDSASLSSQGYPSLRASIAVEPPRRFRLRASFLGPELDVGSNDDQFWFWAKSSPEPGVYFARYDQLQSSSVQQLVPVEPAWLIEAFGLVHLEPGGQHEGPVARGDGMLEVRSRVGAMGQFVRTILIDNKYGWVVQQQVTDTAGRIVAAAKAGNHRFYPEAGASLPHHVEVHIPRAQLTFAIDVSQYSVNQLAGDPAQLWGLPQMEGYNLLNLAESPLADSAPWAPSPPTPLSPDASLPAQVGFQPQYRGYSARR
jgi:hypothetical protein